MCVLFVFRGSFSNALLSLLILLLFFKVSIFLVGDHTVLYIEPTPSGVSDQISNRIYYAGSKLRLNNARYMVSA